MKNWRRLGMKSEWTKKKLSDIADFNPRETIKKGAIAKKIPMDVIRPFYRDIPYYVEESFSGGTKFRNGDTIMARITPCLENGKTAQVSILNDGEIGFGSTEYIVFRAKEGIADKNYLYYLVCSPEIREPAIKSMVGSSGRQRVQTDVVKNLELDVPPLVEQEKIGSFLKAFDDKIALNDRINKNLELQAESIFKSWFIDFEPFNNQKPSNWSVSTLGNVSIMGAGGDKPQNISPLKTDLYQYPIYSNGLSNEGLYGFTNKPKISEESVTVSARGTIGFVCLRHIPYVPIVRLVTLIPQPQIISAKYLYLWLKQLHITGTGTTQQQLTVPDFKKTEILVPSQQIVTLFTNTVDPLFEKIWANQNENEKLSSLRDTLLPKLMSGELDVSAIDI